MQNPLIFDWISAYWLFNIHWLLDWLICTLCVTNMCNGSRTQGLRFKYNLSLFILCSIYWMCILIFDCFLSAYWMFHILWLVNLFSVWNQNVQWRFKLFSQHHWFESYFSLFHSMLSLLVDHIALRLFSLALNVPVYTLI